MYISLKWVQEIIGVQKVTLNGLVNRLTLAGFEIESITSKNYFESSDVILDISFTANRADVSNIRGLITEIITLFTANFFFENPANIKALILREPPEPFNIHSLKVIKTNDKIYPISSEILKGRLLKSRTYKIINTYKVYQCKYSLWEWYLQKKSFNKVIKNLIADNVKNSNGYITLCNVISKKLEIKSSPCWIKNRLLLMGFKPVNNIIDTINYLMIETGQVFFAYDLKTLENFMTTADLVFINKPATQKSLLPISKSKIIALNNNILTLTINNKIISVPGVIQNYDTIVSKTTSYILLQYGLYDSKKIKKSCKNLNLRTDYSIRSEKQTDLNLLEQSYLRLIHLFWTQNIKFKYETNNKNTFKYLKNSFSLFDSYIKQSEKKIKISYRTIKTLTGPYNNSSSLNDFQIIRNLKLLNFKIKLQREENCYVLIPLARKVDVEREIDLVEEIVRVIGFTKFKPLARANTKVGYLTKFEKLKRRIRAYLLNLGFSESVHSILIRKNRKDQIRLKNPLFNESSVLRLTLLDGLVDKVEYNQKNIGEMFETFELGRVYNLLPDGKKKELEVISGIFGAQTFPSSWGGDNSSINWFEAKGILETLMKNLNLSASIYWHPENNSRTSFHPNLTADLFIGDQKFGVFGQIHPILALKKNIKKKIYLFEINMELLNRFSRSKNLINYIPYSSYPISYTDLSFIINKSIFSYEIKKIIYLLGKPLLKSVDLFDYYCNEPIKEGYCSLSFKLKFQSETRTLSNDEIVKTTNRIILYLEKHYDIKFQQ